MNEQLFKELADFLHEQSHSFEVVISPATAIEDDLGVTGDDGEELIINFSRQFNVNIDDFLFTRYFYPEPSFWRKMPEKIEILTAGHLLRAIEAGRLDEELINGQTGR